MKLSLELNMIKEQWIALLPFIYFSFGRSYLFITLHFLWLELHFDIGYNSYCGKWLTLLPWLSIRFDCCTDAWVEVDFGWLRYNNGIRLIRKKSF